MTYFQAESIRQDFHVALEFSDVTGDTQSETIKKVAEKYTIDQLKEAYKTLLTKMKSDEETLQTLFVLALSTKEGI